MVIYIDCDYLAKIITARASVTITITYEIMYVLSIGSFKFDLDSF